jgi:uncharacterized protein YcaQ
MGVATSGDVARYYNLPIAEACLGLEAAGARPVVVEGWRAVGWISASAGACVDITHEPVLIGPFDNLIWDRERTRRVFWFEYVFEAYKPSAARRYGYYVPAVLDNGRLIGRVDLRRDNDRLTVLAAHPEPEVNTAHFSASMENALKRLEQQLQPRAARPVPR